MLTDLEAPPGDNQGAGGRTTLAIMLFGSMVFRGLYSSGVQTQTFAHS